MERLELATQLAAAGAPERARLIREHSALVDTRLVRELKAMFDASKASRPAAAASAADAMQSVADAIQDGEASGLAAWTAGMVALQRNGETRHALALLDESVARFEAMQRPDLAAAAQVSRLHALAVLGRYDAAIAAGLRARDVFEATNDDLAAGKIEQNLGNIYWRREQYADAEQFLRAARARFERQNDARQLAQVDNNLAGVLALQYRFADAESHYQQALAGAESLGQEVTLAEIGVNLGCLALARADYARALSELEGARRRYAALDLPHKLANAEKELGDAYVELNLLPEAVELYERVMPTFARLGMRAELAWATTHYARVLMQLDRTSQAQERLVAAREIFLAESNLVGQATVILAEAELHLRSGADAAAVAAGQRAEELFEQAESPGRLLLARWVRGEGLRRQHKSFLARDVITQVLVAAQESGLPQVAQRCHVSLGLIAVAERDPVAARAAFEQAVELIEALGAPLPADEFRTAFAADKLLPYAELVRLCLERGTPVGVVEAFELAERARSRVLADLMAGAPHDRPVDDQLLARLDALREQLGWLYGQLHRHDTSADADTGRRGTGATVVRMRDAIRTRERAVLEVRRQLAARHTAASGAAPGADDIEHLHRHLPSGTALVAYFSIDAELLAFVVTAGQVDVVRHLAGESEVLEAVRQLRFQVDSLRHGSRRLRGHLPQLTVRTWRHLQRLHDQLLRPLEPLLSSATRLVVVPHRSLHYVPFHALHDGQRYQVERREVSYAPSSAVLQRCLERAASQPVPWRALLVGVSDAGTPHVRDEVVRVAALFPAAVQHLGESATVRALRAGAPATDVLHLATHARFRPDSPMFSALRLADDWLTVHDACELDLSACSLVVLSACETGVSDVAPGDELVGLARGFFAAGAASLLVSLWPVDDTTTADLMVSFYRRLRAGDRPAAALRAAQRELLQYDAHPFFWAPFALHGAF